MSKAIKKFKIKNVPDYLEHMAFGRQIEFLKIIEKFKEEARSTWISIKHTTPAKAIAEFKKLYKPTEFFCSYHDEPNYRDDSFQVWFKSNEITIPQ